jgi:hypothetical protein
MDEFEQRVIVKDFHLKGWANKKIITESKSAFQGSAMSRATVKRRFQNFKTGDLSRPDEPHPGRLLTTLGPVLKKFLDKHPFPSAIVMSRRFDFSLNHNKDRSSWAGTQKIYSKMGGT